MSLIINDKGEMSKGFEILARQVLKMMNLDPGLVLTQISGIHGALAKHVEQQEKIILQNDEILKLLRGQNGHQPEQ